MYTEKEHVSEIETDTGCSMIIKQLTWWQRQFIALFLGQCLSLCLTSCGVTSQSLATFYNVCFCAKKVLNLFFVCRWSVCKSKCCRKN